MPGVEYAASHRMPKGVLGNVTHASMSRGSGRGTYGH